MKSIPIFIANNWDSYFSSEFIKNLWLDWSSLIFKSIINFAENGKLLLLRIKMRQRNKGNESEVQSGPICMITHKSIIIYLQGKMLSCPKKANPFFFFYERLYYIDWKKAGCCEPGQVVSQSHVRFFKIIRNVVWVGELDYWKPVSFSRGIKTAVTLVSLALSRVTTAGGAG